MKEHPILFSTPMIQAILEGRKTQTRRIIKVPKHGRIKSGYVCENGYFFNNKGYVQICYDESGCANFESLYCPYGQIGDRLWIRETFKYGDIHLSENFKPQDIWIHYKAGGREFIPIKGKVGEYPTINWKPSIFMPRWASRITLEITDIKVQRLWEITEEDAIAEGVLSEEGIKDWNEHPLSFATKTSPKDEYARLWERINGKKYSWADNPFVWLISFKRV